MEARVLNQELRIKENEVFVGDPRGKNFGCAVYSHERWPLALFQGKLHAFWDRDNPSEPYYIAHTKGPVIDEIKFKATEELDFLEGDGVWLREGRYEDVEEVKLIVEREHVTVEDVAGIRFKGFTPSKGFEVVARVNGRLYSYGWILNNLDDFLAIGVYGVAVDINKSLKAKKPIFIEGEGEWIPEVSVEKEGSQNG